MVLTGPVVPELSRGFDAYWNSRWAYPVDELFNVSMVPDELTKLRERLRRRIARHPDLDALAQAQDYATTLDKLSQGAPVDAALVVVDEPSVAWLDEPDQLADALSRIAASARNEVLVVTPYLIPTPELLEITPNLIERGVRIRIVTNSLTTNDVVIAQAAYSHYRRRIVDAGIELYELRDDAELAHSLHSDDISLHQKYMVFDGKSVFVGSMNLDHRSLYLNTELGVLVESPELATELADMFEELVSPDNSWRIIRTDTGVAWQSSAGTLQRQPAKSWWQRLRHWFYRLLPVSRQL